MRLSFFLTELFTFFKTQEKSEILGQKFLKLKEKQTKLEKNSTPRSFDPRPSSKLVLNKQVKLRLTKACR